MLNTIVLAGMQTIKKMDTNQNKALYRINNKTMIEYVVDALRQVEDIGKIVVIGPREELNKYIGGKVDCILEAGDTIMENVLSGVRHLGYNEDLLICSSDIPLITPEAIKDFINRAKPLEAEFCYPIIDKKINEKKYPEIERTYVKIKEGCFTGGNIFYVNPRVVEKGFELGDKLLKARKNPLKMARLLSLGFVIQMLAGTLTIDKIERKFSKILKVKGKAIVSEYPEIGNDVDKPGDVIVATAYLSK